ncbi:hypothetical protein A3724_15425 [Alcanivorax sp. HI0033]|nr:hypothetical protein A3713_12615 [Alcanivorax sp. HI0003]KZX71873.1 hypothetical protein A3714_04615 [Alcanivorax sp. HI0007]KZX79615.1 hypothetical protein A3716_01100 [Alcanivorax sp. HI0011]KZX89505.1 hypothetical protein A3717_04895 [Alcanivorax sp. HI0013]KZY10217.1 hypothetical protein A3724_15425 [Alcanivorax sp. HI0033]KZY12268.1 hypothetical protein A3725_14090 [Alcanivorax sp. HI0035]
MATLLNALLQPEVVAGVVVTIALVFIEPVIRNVREFLWAVLRTSPSFVRSQLRASKCRHLRRIRRLRWNSDDLLFKVIRVHTYFVLFIFSIGFYIVLMSIGPLKGLSELPLSVQYLITAPIYIFEVVWLLLHYHVRELMASRAKLGGRLR